MCDRYNISILAGPDTDRSRIQDLLDLPNHLSNRVRNQVTVSWEEVDCALPGGDYAVAIDGFIVNEHSLASLIDLLHLQFQRSFAA